MEAFLERLNIEQQELRKKIEGLSKGLNSDGFFEKVGKYQYDLLSLQYNSMIAYEKILDLRIQDLKTK